VLKNKKIYQLNKKIFILEEILKNKNFKK